LTPIPNGALLNHVLRIPQNPYYRTQGAWPGCIERCPGGSAVVRSS